MVTASDAFVVIQRVGQHVLRSVDAAAKVTSTPRDVRVAYTQAFRELTARGCAAATYRLSGPGEWPRRCVRTLPRNWRLVMEFPSPSIVHLLILEPHDKDHDPYLTLAQMLHAEREPGPDRDKPGCCEPDGSPPTAAVAAND